MRFSISIVFFILIYAISGQVTAQESFDRLHRVSQNLSLYSQDINQLDNENYVVFSAVDTLNEEDIEITAVNLSFFTPKGDFNRAVEYYFRDTIDLELDGQVEQTEFGYVFCALSAVDTMFNIIVVPTDIQGNAIWSMTYGSGMEIDEDANHKVELVNVQDSVFVVLATVEAEDSQEIGLIGIDADNGDVLWFNSYQVDSIDNVVNALDHDISINSDTTTVVVAGNLDDDGSIYLLEANAFTGEIIWSRTHAPLGAVNSNTAIQDVKVAPDSTILVTGTVDERAVIMSFDPLGLINWGFEVAEPFNTNGLSLDILETGTLRVAGGLVTDEEDTYTPFQVSMTQAGTVINQNQFPMITGSSLVDVELDGTLDEGSILIGAAVDTESNGDIFPRLIKQDAMGVTRCEEELMLTLEPILFTPDTLLWEATAISNGSDTIEQTTAGTSPVVTPRLSLRDTTFCPGDPVEFLLDAEYEGAVSFIWFDAEEPTNILGTDTTFLATELDIQYVVIVEVVDEFCFIQCDTTTLTDLDPPTVQIIPNTNTVCADGEFLLTAQPMGSNLIGTPVWSTGETTNSITSTEFGTFSVTVTNRCEDIGTASIDILLEDIRTPTIPTIKESDLCDTPGELELSVATQDGFTNILWSTGETTSSIIVTEPGTFTVMAIDTCGFEVNDQFVVGDGDIFEPVLFDLSIGVCDEANNTVDLSLNVIQGDPVSITWISINDDNIQSPVATDVESIENVSSENSYFVQIQDACGNILESPTIIDPCQCLRFPNAFIPTNQGSRDFTPNDTFGPVNNCSEVLSYNLKIFNRFGQQVFESDAVEDEWTGLEGNNIDRAGVYVWVARYETNNGEFSLRGDVTLLQ